MNRIDVSIVIVCMNNLYNLYPCLDSIKKYTSVTYEAFVVAYLFSKENLKKVKAEYPWVIFVESNEIRGFSENNNLALRHAKGKYCFLLNDDTYIEEDVISKLVDSFRKLQHNAAIVSPIIKSKNGTIQYEGRNKETWLTFLKSQYGIPNIKEKITYSSDLIETYNILGAAFLIKYDIFQKVGFFDEHYFFCPEDIALSTKLNEDGYKCYVNRKATVIHLGGNSGADKISKIKAAIMPAGDKGSVDFFSQKSIIKYITIVILTVLSSAIKGAISRIKWIFFKDERYKIISKGYINIVCGLIFYRKKSPKEIFINYLNKI